MDNKAFVKLFVDHISEGLVMLNPGKGTSTVVWCNESRVCYKRGNSSFRIDLSQLHEAYRSHRGRVLTTNNLKEFAPDVFDSKGKGHNCHCTFFFMALMQMGIVSEINGTGRSGDPFCVSL